MDIASKLYLYPEIEDKVSELRKEITVIQADKYEMSTTTNISAVPTAGNRSKDDVMIEMIERCDTQIGQKKTQIEKLLKLKEMIAEGLRPLSNSEACIVKKRYFEKKNWSDISQEFGVSRNWLYRKDTKIKKKILQNIFSVQSGVKK